MFQEHLSMFEIDTSDDESKEENEELFTEEVDESESVDE